MANGEGGVQLLGEEINFFFVFDFDFEAETCQLCENSRVKRSFCSTFFRKTVSVLPPDNATTEKLQRQQQKNSQKEQKILRSSPPSPSTILTPTAAAAAPVSLQTSDHCETFCCGCCSHGQDLSLRRQTDFAISFAGKTLCIPLLWW